MTTTRVRVAIIGAGFAGIGTALQLRATGEDSFLVIDRGSSVGGTWRDNTYPGVACDIPSHLYCFSFLPNPWFSRRFAGGDELHRYLQDAAEPVRDQVRLSTTMTGATWRDDESVWEIETDRGDVVADALVLACGRLSEPNQPDVPGHFDGPVMHSARWDDSVDLAGRHVGVVGTGASAAQLLPHVARSAASVTVLQRSAPYVLPRDDQQFAPEQQARWAAAPELLADVRSDLFADAERGHAARMSDGPARRALAARARDHLERQVSDPALRSALTPLDEFGCKRPIFSDDYYPTLGRHEVSLVTSALTGYAPDAMLTQDGGRHRVDVIVLATGFASAQQPYADLVRGRNGTTLADHWRQGMRAYASTSVAGFPNMFVVNGPNASLGHSSSVLMIEAQIGYVVEALRWTPRGTRLDVRRAAEDAYVGEMDRRSAASVWLSGCSNWYVDPRNGRQVLLWPGTATEFADRMSRFDPAAYQITPGERQADWSVVVPLKPPGAGKSRLHVPGVDHTELARAIALDTLDAATGSRRVAEVLVVSADTTWELPPGATLVHESASTSIADAVCHGIAAARTDTHKAVLLGDLPGLQPDELDNALAAARSVDRAAVPDQEGTGTTLVTFRPQIEVITHFGPGSWSAHQRSGHRRLDVPDDSGLRRDVDELAHLRRGPLGPRTSALLGVPAGV